MYLECIRSNGRRIDFRSDGRLICALFPDRQSNYIKLSSLVSFVILGLFSAVINAYRFEWNNITCQGLHGPHCGIYLSKVKGQNDTYIGQSYFVGDDALSQGPADTWGRFLREEYKLLPRFTTVQTLNDTGNFVPFVGTTNIETCNFQSIENAMTPFVNTVTNELSFDAWADTSMNATAVKNLAPQLLKASTYAVQVATCTPGFMADLLESPTVNIFNNDEILPPWCQPVEIEAVCPAYVNYQTR
ncbi:LANO_0C06238g1_1 [Lachancea nothofagi CBS 11611]|uniref:LANO_0C06238g1_1 n=1 Tax=Lachancea nothofagi CBS 11611 TaxID=1266666 RepID=A0A1G4J7Z8_9SACH|nr:LANO_0C06238g1_1 [Lachancea nothofagi CBS 11611]